MGLLADVIVPQSVGQGTLAALAAFGHYCIVLVIYRLFFHPLRNVPGPCFAAATSWYEFYQDVILVGHYVSEYPILHQKYGK